jgi:hypothetical protein
LKNRHEAPIRATESRKKTQKKAKTLTNPARRKKRRQLVEVKKQLRISVDYYSYYSTTVPYKS